MGDMPCRRNLQGNLLVFQGNPDVLRIREIFVIPVGYPKKILQGKLLVLRYRA
jgi:hypothetical protein